MTLEHGHANHLSDDWASTAYWYQTLPGPKLKIPDVEKRLVRRPILPSPELKAPDLNTLRLDAREMHLKQQEKMKAFLEKRKSEAERRAKDSKERALKNKEIAAEVRSRFMNNSKGN